jgi:hypothetical protein
VKEKGRREEEEFRGPSDGGKRTHRGSWKLVEQLRCHFSAVHIKTPMQRPFLSHALCCQGSSICNNCIWPVYMQCVPHCDSAAKVAHAIISTRST